MNAMVLQSEMVQPTIAAAVNTGGKSNLPTINNGFAMVLGGLLQANGNEGELAQLLGDIEELIAYVDRMLEQKTEDHEETTDGDMLGFTASMLQQSVSTLLQKESILSLVQKMSVKHHAALNQQTTSDSSNVARFLQSSDFQLNMFAATKEENAMLQSYGPNEVQGLTLPQQKEMLQAIHSLLTAAQQGRVSLNQSEIGKLRQAVSRLLDGSASSTTSRAHTQLESVTDTISRNFGMLPLARATTSTFGDATNHASPQALTSPTSTEQMSTDGAVTKAGFHQFMMSNAQSVATNQSQPTEGEPVVRAQYVQRDLNDFMVRQLQMTRFPNGVSEAKIRLFPENLGTVDVKLTIHQGIVTAQFIAGTKAGKELLDSNLAGLRASLISSGLQVEKLEVTVPNNQSNGQAHDTLHQQKNEQQDAQYEQQHEQEEVEEEFSSIFERFSQVV